MVEKVGAQRGCRTTGHAGVWGGRGIGATAIIWWRLAAVCLRRGVSLRIATGCVAKAFHGLRMHT